MSAPKTVFVTWFDIPAEPAFCRRPIHKIGRDFSPDCIRCHSVASCMNPLRPHANHKLRLLRQSPGLLENKVGIPLGRVPSEKRCNPRLNFQPVLDRRNFHRNRRAETRAISSEALRRSTPNFDYGGRLLLSRPLVGRLRQGISEGKTQTRYPENFHAALVSHTSGTLTSASGIPASFGDRFHLYRYTIY